MQRSALRCYVEVAAEFLDREDDRLSHIVLPEKSIWPVNITAAKIKFM